MGRVHLSDVRQLNTPPLVERRTDQLVSFFQTAYDGTVLPGWAE